MKKSLKAFMNGLIDYAGLFPPAELSLDTSIRKYSEYKKSTDAWMLSRFIIPWKRLKELTPYADNLFQKKEPFSFSVLGKPTAVISDFNDEIEQIIETSRRFVQYHGNRVQTDLAEIKLPEEVALSGDQTLIREILDSNAERFSLDEESPQTIFYEACVESSWKKDYELILKGISEHNASLEQTENYRQAGFKIRCGGVDPEMVPPVEQLAFAINRAREQSVALKCTAGLHHPVRHYDETVGSEMHGFFNVFGGALLAYAHDLSDEELYKILIEQDAEKFEFTDDFFRWNDYAIPVDEIKELREVALLSFGSCSFDEPREDLRKINLL